MTDKSRLIEVAFPLKQASLDSVHEKNVRHGHISTLHIWPARRPLAACRAALIATLLPDPGDAEERAKLLEKLGGRVVPTVKKKKMPNGKIEEIQAEETVGGILHWGRENGPDLDWFRQRIREAYGGRAPKVLDPFAGGGAIPLEAMRLGCEATAIDINPVAWFILKCTLEYPQKLTGKKLPLPDFILEDREFMEQFCKAHKLPLPAKHARHAKGRPGDHADEFPDLSRHFASLAGHYEADLAWHVRAWGRWVLKRARPELAELYPTYASWEPVLATEQHKVPRAWLVQWKKEHAAAIEARGLRLCPLTPEGEVDQKKLNEEFSAEYLAEPTKPRWVPKPTVAYLWARTVRNSQHLETTVPLLKTCWLCKTDSTRVLLTLRPKEDRTGVAFGIQQDVPKVGGNAAQRREHDKRISAGTMSRTGARCPVHGNIIEMDVIRDEGKRGRLGMVLTAVALDGQTGKEFRLPTQFEIEIATGAERTVERVFEEVPFGVPHEALPSKEALGFRVPLYGIDEWHKLYTRRQLLALGVFVKATRRSAEALKRAGLPQEWREALFAYLVCGFERLVDFCNVNTQWKTDVPTINHALVRFAIQITWDFAEGNTIGKLAGSYLLCLDRIAIGLETFRSLPADLPAPTLLCQSAIGHNIKADIVVTDPPYYDAIPYSDLMDWFYVWLRRCAADFSEAYANAMEKPVGPKWDQEKQDGELIDDASRHHGDAAVSMKTYEEGMARVFRRCAELLAPDGRVVVVFANKQPKAWETLAASFVKAGFVVEGSWPIQTEQPSRTRGQASAALASSVWLVGKNRHPAARPGWDNIVLKQMRERIAVRLREFWDAGIRGPDFVWAATGPAMEAYSQYPVVKKANKPNELMSVSEFLRHVRRMVLDFVVGRVLSKATGGGEAATEELDDVTTYYLLHRNDFKMGEAPSGACILYCVSCNLSDRDLVDAFDLLVPSGGTNDGDEEEEQAGDDDEEMAEGSSSTFKLKPWNKRKRPGMGYDPVVDSPRARNDAAQGRLFQEGPEKPRTRIIPLIDQIHRLMHLWKAGDVVKVDEYLNSKSLRTNALFPPVLQAVIEMADAGSEERSILESLSNHVQGRSVRAEYQGEIFTQNPAGETEGV
ncbi:MAG: DUF1156 domain-containing protein [Verrucomicrobiales bacterium]|nr:DUF1156 domain-containing protein [Verrucomicrobiales bacterium]